MSASRNNLQCVLHRVYLKLFAFPDEVASPYQKATLTKAISAGTSAGGPITPTNASPEFNPSTATATAIANSKLLLTAVKERVAVWAQPLEGL